MSEDYAARIKQLVGVDFALDWQHPFDLANMLETYLRAKRTRTRLSPAESQLEQAIAGMFDPLVGSDDIIFVAPAWEKATTLMRLAETESVIAFAELQKFGRQLALSDWQFFSWHHRATWLVISGLAFQALGNGYAQMHRLTAVELQSVFCEKITNAYWPLSQQAQPEAALARFWLMVQIDGDWLLALLDVLERQKSSEFMQLLVLWLQWVVAEKSQLAGRDTSILVKVKRLIAALQAGDLTHAGPLLIRCLPELMG